MNGGILYISFESVTPQFSLKLVSKCLYILLMTLGSSETEFTIFVIGLGISAYYFVLLGVLAEF